MDMHTLHIEHAVLLGVFTVLTVANSLLHRGIKGVGWFPLYTFYAFLGAVLIALRGHLPVWAAVGAGGLFFSVAYVFLHRWLTEFFGRRAYQWLPQVFLAAAALGVQVRFGLMEANTQHRLFFYSLVLAAQLAMSAVFVFRAATGPLRASGWVMGGLLSLLCANNLVRAVGTMVMGAPENYLEGGWALSWTLMSTSVLQGAVTIAFVWMTAAGLRRELEVQALTDPLTGLLNRRAIEMTAEREIQINGLRRQPISAILIDLDGFKQINDSFGHHCGDAVLIAVAQCLRQKMRRQDYLARLGGDEFVLLLPNTAWDEASKVAERLRSCLEETEPLPNGYAAAKVRASFGVAELGSREHGWDHLIMSCDRAMYAVKELGGNQVLVH
ncbi:MAG: GGDEF domain-containing protein [Acidobacteriaceae bacterium]